MQVYAPIQYHITYLPQTGVLVGSRWVHLYATQQMLTAQVANMYKWQAAIDISATSAKVYLLIFVFFLRYDCQTR